jgi:L-amino acid N-acyltransferase YncA
MIVGIASLLITYIIDFATTLPIPPKRILSMIQPDNVPSLSMHSKHGFLNSGTLYLRENDLRILLLKQLPVQENK